jgi:hypothetical protein
MADATVNYFPTAGTATINTVSTGLTLSSGTLTNNLSTGVSGGQSVVGGTAASENLTLSSTAHATKGKLILGSSTYYFDETLGQLVLGNAAAPNNSTIVANRSVNSSHYNVFANANASGNALTAIVAGNAVDLSGSSVAFFQYGTGYTTAGLQVANAGEVVKFGGSANLLYSVAQAAGDHVFTTTTSRTERFRITTGGNKVCGPAALATNATDGFLYIPTCAGTPTGVPTAYTGMSAIVFDTTNNKLYVYDGGWLGGTAPGVWS